VVLCVNALESAIKAKLGVPPDERKLQLRDLLTQVRSQFPDLNEFDGDKIRALRDKRNQLVHYGFSPKDDRECAVLLLDVGLPFLNLCYKTMYDFYLDWHEIRPGITTFDKLTSAEMSKAGLVPDVAEQLGFIMYIYKSANGKEGFNPEHSFYAFIHFIRMHLKQSAMSQSEMNSLEDAESRGIQYDNETKLKNGLERLFHDTCNLDCPICYGIGTMIVELDENSLSEGDIAPDRCGCVRCGFVVGRGASYISKVLLATQMVESRERLLKEFGLTDRG